MAPDRFMATRSPDLARTVSMLRKRTVPWFLALSEDCCDGELLNAPLLRIDFGATACFAEEHWLIVWGEGKPRSVRPHKLNFMEVDDLAGSVFTERYAKDTEIIAIIGDIHRLSI